MIISPRDLIERGVYTGVDEECIQPSGIDLRVSKILKVSMGSISYGEYCYVPKTGKIDHAPLEPVLARGEKGLYCLSQQGVYQFETEVYVNLPEDVAGWIIARSSLNRNGIRAWSGLYDPGFRNYIGGVLYVPQHTVIEQGARIAQFIAVKADSAHLYAGRYQDRAEIDVAPPVEKGDTPPKVARPEQRTALEGTASEEPQEEGTAGAR